MVSVIKCITLYALPVFLLFYLVFLLFIVFILILPVLSEYVTEKMCQNYFILSGVLMMKFICIYIIYNVDINIIPV